jgi:large subunit ribosomal protein L20
MPRVKGGYVTRRRRKRILKLAKGYFGSKHTLYKTANEQVMRSLAYAYRDRKQTKRNFRKLWITRINAACRTQDISYSKFMHGLKLANIDVNRKMLADLAVNDINGFNQLVALAKDAIANPEKFAQEEKAAKPKKAVKKEVKEIKEEVKKAEEKAEEKVEEKETAKKAEKVEEKAAEKEEVTGPTTEAELKKLTVKDLREIAKDRNVTIPSGSRKADIVKLLAE